MLNKESVVQDPCEYGQTYAIETFGCQMNVHDSERMAGLLEQTGYVRIQDAIKADVVILNTCSVRERAEDKLFSRLGEISADRRQKPPLMVVTGCLAQQEGADIFKRANQVDVVVGTQAIRRLPELLDRAKNKGSNQIDVNPYEDVSFPLGLAVRTDPVKAYVTIVEGCNDFCAFCVVPYTRGHERMRISSEIVSEVKAAVSSGHREVHLLGQIVNHYQCPVDQKCDFAGLLEKLNEVSGLLRIRFASPHPRHVNNRMISAMRDLPTVCGHLHLPLQSGSTRVLRAMRRRHTRENYLELVERVRAAIPTIALSTDIIIGFPGEAEEDFQETLSLVKQVGYSSMFSFKYSERPATLASRRIPETVTESEKTQRIVELQSVQRQIQLDLNKQSIGTTASVLADNTSRRHDRELSGRTGGNLVVNFPGDPQWVGRLVNVKIKKAGPHSVWGESVTLGEAGQINAN
jgi:tRNA-2-methylthio-N6-dimethylallyladenosine synthase